MVGSSLFHSAVAVLLASLIFHHPSVAARLRRPGLALIMVGSLIPLLDYVVFYFRSQESITFFIQDPIFSGLYYGLLLLAVLAALTGPLAGWRRAAPTFVFLSLGYGLHQALCVLTPLGAPLLMPFTARRLEVPIFPAGHPLLLAVLILSLVSMEAMPRFKRFFFRCGVSLVVLYGLAGGGQFTYIAFQARALAPEEGRVFIEPADFWLTKWLVIAAGEESYRLRQHHVGLRKFADPLVIPNWNNGALMIQALGNPVVNRYYTRVFRHPVVQLDSSGSQFTLTMRELKHLGPVLPGRRFYFAMDLDGAGRLYKWRR